MVCGLFIYKRKNEARNDTLYNNIDNIHSIHCMKQVVPRLISKEKKNRKKKPKVKYNAFHNGKPFKQRKIIDQKYGTSQLEKRFARDFLDRMGLVYIYQYEAKDIKRFFDFALTCYDDVEYMYEEKDGIRCVRQDGQLFPLDLLIEVDGSFYHSDPRVVSEDKITPMHKHNKFVDGLKDQWAALHCIPLLRIWEYDIIHNPKMVEKEIEKYIKSGKRKKEIKENRKKPH